MAVAIAERVLDLLESQQRFGRNYLAGLIQGVIDQTSKKIDADLIVAFEKYIDNTVGEYGESRMFDCGVVEARQAIARAKAGIK